MSCSWHGAIGEMGAWHTGRKNLNRATAVICRESLVQSFGLLVLRGREKGRMSEGRAMTIHAAPPLQSFHSLLSSQRTTTTSTNTRIGCTGRRPIVKSSMDSTPARDLALSVPHALSGRGYGSTNTGLSNILTQAITRRLEDPLFLVNDSRFADSMTLSYTESVFVRIESQG